MSWEAFRGRMKKVVDQPTVTLSKMGTIALNAFVVRKILGDMRFAMLMFDREKRFMGIKFLKQNEADAYPVRVTDNDSHGQISGVAFMRSYDIYPEKTTNLPARYDEQHKMLVVDVSGIKGAKKKE